MTKMMVTVDIVIFTIVERRLHILLIKRLATPYQGSFAIPGGFVLEDESLEAAAKRELQEETGLAKVYLEQLYTFGDPGRDPRGRVVTVAYYALVPNSQVLSAGTDAAEAAWFPIDELPPLAFDHLKIVRCAHERLANKLDYTNVGFEFLPEQFTLTELQMVHEAVLGQALDKRNFRRKIMQSEIVEATDQWQKAGRKPAQLYRFRHP